MAGAWAAPLQSTTLAPEPCEPPRVQSLGPNMREFIATCVKANPRKFLSIWAIGLLAVVATLWIALSHRKAIMMRPPSLQRVHYGRIALFAPMLAMTSTSTLFCPRVFHLAKMLGHLAEAIALGSFGQLLFLKCAEESGKRFELAPVGTRSSAGVMLQSLNANGPKQHFAVPPFGCCLTKCLPQHRLKPWHLRAAIGMTRQFVFVVVVVAVGRMWMALALSSDASRVAGEIMENIEKLSSFLCIYGLFIVYKCTHDLLEHWRPTAKFVSLKLILLIMTWQDMMIKQLVRRIPPADELCLADPQRLGQELQDLHREHFNDMFLVSIEAVLVAYLVRRAFERLELCEQNQEFTSGMLDLDLMKLEAQDLEDTDSSSDSGSADGTTDARELVQKVQNDEVHTRMVEPRPRAIAVPRPMGLI